MNDKPLSHIDKDFTSSHPPIAPNSILSQQNLNKWVGNRQIISVLLDIGMLWELDPRERLIISYIARCEWLDEANRIISEPAWRSNPVDQRQIPCRENGGYKNLKLELGSILQDNDNRSKGRTLTIVEILPDDVWAQDNRGRFFSIAKKRIHLDGKYRQYEFNLTEQKSKRPIL